MPVRLSDMRTTPKDERLTHRPRVCIYVCHVFRVPQTKNALRVFYGGHYNREEFKAAEQ